MGDNSNLFNIGERNPYGHGYDENKWLQLWTGADIGVGGGADEVGEGRETKEVTLMPAELHIPIVGAERGDSPGINAFVSPELKWRFSPEGTTEFFGRLRVGISECGLYHDHTDRHGVPDYYAMNNLGVYGFIEKGLGDTNTVYAGGGVEFFTSTRYFVPGVFGEWGLNSDTGEKTFFCRHQMVPLSSRSRHTLAR